MKKLLSTILVLSMVIAIFSFPVNAAKGGKAEKNSTDSSVDQTVSDETPSEKLEKDYKNKDKNAKKELIKQIVSERRANHDYSIPVFVNGKEVKFDVPPVIKNGRTLIPVRAVTNALGANVEWDGANNTVTITKDTTTIVITLGSNVATVNGTEVELDSSAELVNHRTLVPIRFIAEILKQNVEWDPDTGSVIIEDDDDDSSTTPDAITIDTNSDSSATDD